MSNGISTRRIHYAYFLEGWSRETGSRQFLKANARKVFPSEFTLEMKGSLFCPECMSTLNRRPESEDTFSNGREAHFYHNGSKEIPCNLRSVSSQGKKYTTYEEARQAIDDENLGIIHEFLKEKPEDRELPSATPYEETVVEDINGPETDMPIGRHDGQTYKLPSTITTIAGLCRNFEDNLYKYYVMPEETVAYRLIDIIKDAKDVSIEEEKPKLYWGRISGFYHMGNHKRPDNIRYTYLENNQNSQADFSIKMIDSSQNERGITQDTKGRIVIIYGKVQTSGVGICFSRLGWGEFALLPEKYEYLFE